MRGRKKKILPVKEQREGEGEKKRHQPSRGPGRARARISRKRGDSKEEEIYVPEYDNNKLAGSL